jgi:mannan endo-1,4-beta-mannosidase
MKHIISTNLLFLTTVLSSLYCSDKNEHLVKTNDILVDSIATKETVALFTNLKTFAADKFLFGHQETTAYGVGWVNYGSGTKSDVQAVCGDFPAVYGWDIGDICAGKNVDGVPFSEIKSLIKIAYERGG